MTDDLARLRVDRAKTNRDVRPVDLLRAMADDIEAGRIQVDALLCVYLYTPAGREWDFGAYRAGLSFDQEVVVLEIAKNRCLKRWIGE